MLRSLTLRHLTMMGSHPPSGESIPHDEAIKLFWKYTFSQIRGNVGDPPLWTPPGTPPWEPPPVSPSIKHLYEKNKEYLQYIIRPDALFLNNPDEFCGVDLTTPLWTSKTLCILQKCRHAFGPSFTGWAQDQLDQDKLQCPTCRENSSFFYQLCFSFDVGEFYTLIIFKHKKGKLVEIHPSIDLMGNSYTLEELWETPNKQFPHLICRTIENLPASFLAFDFLTYLEFDKCDSMQELPLLPSHLSVLKLSRCSRIRHISSISPHQHLKELMIKECQCLEELPDLPDSLQTLQLEKCGRLKRQTSVKGKEHLSEVYLENLPFFSHLLFIHPHAIKKLIIMKCPKIAFIYSYPSLEHLLVNHLPLISHIDLRNCFHLHTVLVHGLDSLESIRLINCTALRTFEVTGCPSLQGSIIKREIEPTRPPRADPLGDLRLVTRTP